jgi:hypothetical protein
MLFALAVHITNTSRALVLSLSCAACGHATPPPAPLENHGTGSAAAAKGWPVPDGWRKESFTFPIEFAPSIPHEGREDLRFPPGFLDAKSPEFWSYVFVWWLDDDRPLDSGTLSSDLDDYFDGLADAVDKDTHKLPKQPRGTSAIVMADLATGQVDTWDAFTTGNRVELHLRMKILTCGAKHAVVFELSPAADDAAIWKQLDALAGEVRCP